MLNLLFHEIFILILFSYRSGGWKKVCLDGSYIAKCQMPNTSFSVLMLEENLWRYKVEITVRNSVKDKTSQDVISYSFKGQPNSITVENKYDLVGLDLSKISFNRVLTKSRKLFWILQLAIEKAAELQTP